MRAKQTLTHNAILYTSVGFQQDCLLQVLSLRMPPAPALQMILYDGTVYTGAIYPLKKDNTHRTKTQEPLGVDDRRKQDPRLPRQLDVIRVRPILAGNNEPLLIEELEVIQRGVTQIMGKQVLSLEQYMKRRKFISLVELDEEQPEEILPSKKVKSDSQAKTSKADQMRPDQKAIALADLPEVAEQGCFRPAKYIEGVNPVGMKKGSEVSITNECKSKSGSFTLKSEENLSRQKIIPNDSRQKIIPNEPPRQVAEGEGGKQPQESKSNNSIPSQFIELLNEDQPQIIEIRSCQKGKRSKKTIDLVNDSHIEIKPSSSKANSQGFRIEKTPATSEMMIEDLYERMLRFCLLCRINHISHFKTKKGAPCTKMMIVDEKGDEILCMLFDKSDPDCSERPPLLKGRVYYFENGDVEKDQNGFLFVSMPWANIRQTKSMLPSFHPSKMMRVGELENIAPNHFLEKVLNSNNKSINNKRSCSKDLSVCGIFIGYKDEPKLVNNQFRVVGILCDPDQEKSINFTLFTDELSSFPKPGAPISLHNMHVTEHERTYRLQQSKRSYFLIESQNRHKYFEDLIEASNKESWKLIEYTNLSEVKFVTRKISELKSLLSKMLENDQCYSQIDCNIASVSEKRCYSACDTCHHDIKVEKGVRSFCYHCKRIEKVTKRFIYNAEVADCTGAINVKVFSGEISNFINTQAEDYANMSEEERKSVLELSSYQNILLKVKSEQLVGGPAHLIVKASKIDHKRGLQEIKDQSITQKTSYRPVWL